MSDVVGHGIFVSDVLNPSEFWVRLCPDEVKVSQKARLREFETFTRAKMNA